MVTGRWLTVQQVAEVLQVRIETVRRWIRRGDIPVLDIGGPRTVYRIRQVDLDEFVRERFRSNGGDPDAVKHDPEAEADDNSVSEAALQDFASANQSPRELVEQMPAVTFREARRHSGSLTFLSREIETILGYTVEDLINRPGGWIDAVHSDDRARVTRELSRTDESGDPFRMDYRMIHKDGRVVWISVDAVLVESGDFGDYWEGAIVDVTERRSLESALRQRLLQQQTVADLGKIALEGASIGSLLQQTARRVCEAMGATRVILYEMLPGGGSMSERAHYHLNSYVESDTSFWQQNGNADESDPLSAFGSGQQKPVVSGRLAQDKRFAGELMESIFGERSGISLNIPGRVRPYGVLTVLSSEPRATSPEDLLFLQAVVNVIGSAVAQADNHWLTVNEVADLLQVTEDTVRRWIRNLDLPALSLGGARAGYRVYPSDLERFIQHRLKRLK